MMERLGALLGVQGDLRARARAEIARVVEQIAPAKGVAARVAFKSSGVNAALAQSRGVKGVRIHKLLHGDAKSALGEAFKRFFFVPHHAQEFGQTRDATANFGNVARQFEGGNAARIRPDAAQRARLNHLRDAARNRVEGDGVGAEVNPFLQFLASDQARQRLPLVFSRSQKVSDVAAVLVRTGKRQKIACGEKSLRLGADALQNSGRRDAILGVKSGAAARTENRLNRQTGNARLVEAKFHDFTDFVFVDAARHAHHER